MIVVRNYSSDEELLEILNQSNKQMSLGNIAIDNSEAVNEIEQFLELQNAKLLPTSMGDIQRRFSAAPYGWKEIDIAGVVITLVAVQKVVLQYNGNAIQPSDRHIPDYLRRKNEIDKTIVKRRTAISDSLMKRAREFLKEYFNTMDLPSDEDGIIEYILENFSKEQSELQTLLDREYRTVAYPGRSVVETGVKLCNDLLSQKKDNTALLTKMLELEDDFLDHSEDMTEIRDFFKVQRTVFDSAAALLQKLEQEKGYLQADQTATGAIAQIAVILKQPRPYQNIAELPGLMQSIQVSYDQLLVLKRQEVIADIQAAMGEIHQTAQPSQSALVTQADQALTAKKEAAEKTDDLTALDAMKIQISNLRQQYLRALVVEEKPNVDTVTAGRSGICHTVKLESEADVDAYVAEIKEKLMELLDGHDVLHII